MHENSTDARIALEWIPDREYWAFPLLDHKWIEFRGLLSKSNLDLVQISPDSYHVEVSPRGEHRIVWSAPMEERPPHVYGLIAFRPKAPSTYFGIPLILLVPVFTAVIGVVGTISLQLFSSKDPDLSICSTSKEWTLTSTFNECKFERDRLQSINETVDACVRSEKDLHTYILPRMTSDRVLYLMGVSQGYRVEGIMQLLGGTPFAKELAIQAENGYVSNLLNNDTHKEAYTSGLNFGQQNARKILELGETQILSGQDQANLR